MTTEAARLAVSVVIPTHNPRMDYLRRVLEALRGQTLEQSAWELVVVDNNSKPALQVASSQTSVGREKPNCIDLSWHANARIVREEKLGLTFARLRGFAEARGELIVMVDDDNVLAPDYLETAVRIAQERPELGAFGGKCLPEFEVEPPEWLVARGKGLGLRDRGEVPQLFPEETGGGLKDQETQRLRDEEGESGKVGKFQRGKVKRMVSEFPDCAPIGAGMVLRREAAAAYAERMKQRTTGSASADRYNVTSMTITDRKGDSLASGGDNDICLTVVEEGWQVGYMPQLQLAHLIPARRMTLDYHKRMARDSMKSFILMLDQHGIRPWPAMPQWTLPLRVVSDWLRVKPWRSPSQSLRFWGNVGMYEGRAALAAA